MSSDLHAFDNISFHRDSNSDMVSHDGSGDLLFFSDPYPLPFFTGSNIDVAQEKSKPSPDPFSLSHFSFSPSSTHLENQSLYQANRTVQPMMPNGLDLEGEFTNFSALLDGSEVKFEECQLGVDYTYNQHFLPHSYSGAESVSKFMQRSSSCNSFDGKPGFPLEAHRDTPMDSPNFQWHALSSPENSFFTGQMRRTMKTTHTSQTEGTLLEEANFKVGRYSAEERKEKISKYRAKRSQRNFNKTIKYACRKTLADNRTRIRGRFARNDETNVIP